MIRVRLFSFFVLLIGAGFAPSVSTAAELEATGAARAAHVAELTRLSREQKLSSDLQWVRLLHYRHGLFGDVSEAADPAFFFSQTGRTDPQAELEATLRAFFDPAPPSGENAQAPRCKFPARYLWLAHRLPIRTELLPPADCSRFERFASRVAARSVSVIFSSYYLNNPSSAFGHSFLRLNKTESPRDGRHYELLDYGINYAAVADSGNAIAYAIKGVIGAFAGTFTSIPYYYKVREYNDYEARDLWEYDLNLTAPQLEMLVAHIWELGATSFPYYYFTRNCSYELLTLLEAANPALGLTERTPYIAIPVDTIRVLNTEPGLVTGRHFRASVRRQFVERLGGLDPVERAALSQTLRARSVPTLPTGMSATQKAAVLDAAADYIDFKHNRELIQGQGAPGPARWKQELLLARSELGIPSEALVIAPPAGEAPESGHGTRRVTLEEGYGQDLRGFSRLEYRFALHDLTDPSPGYPEYAQIEMGKLAVRENYQGGFGLDEATLFHVISLNPWSEFDQKPSWRVRLSEERTYDNVCNHCLKTSFSAGGGIALRPEHVPLTAFFLVDGEALAGSSFSGAHFRPGVAPEAGLRLRVSKELNWLARVQYHHRFFAGPDQSWDALLEGRLGLGARLALLARARAYPGFSSDAPRATPSEKEVSLGLSYYY